MNIKTRGNAMASAAIPTELTEDQKVAWDRDGFLIFDRFIDDETVAELRTAYDEVIDRKVTVAGNVLDGLLGSLIRQVLQVHEAHPAFDANPAVELGHRLARELLGAQDVHRSFDMLIYKPPQTPSETPWHQDASYDVRPVAPAGNIFRDNSVQFWIPLDDVDEENSCMRFIPGRHREPLLEHYVVSDDPDDPQRLLAITDPASKLDLDSAVSGVIPAGGATVHRMGTPHYTGPNRSETRQRRAYIFNISIT
jgi:ectoine hydroxylase-related dioxygenase (phytanoyl-CoA dioxygenase family)